MCIRDRFPCMLGYILKQCRGDNFWYNVTDAYCGCASPESGLKEFEHVEAGKSKTVKCGAGWMSIQCDATGHFNQSSLVNSASVLWMTCGERRLPERQQ